MTRTLSLKRDVLQELSSDELSVVVAGTETSFSCLDFISCNPLDCLLTFDSRCIE